MPVVTLVEPQKKHPHRFNVYLDGKFSFGADEDLIVEHRLVQGKQIDPQLLEKLLFDAEVGKLMDRIYTLLNIRPRSEREIRQYLHRLSFKRKIKDQEPLTDLVVESLITRLKQKGLLNDQEFSARWVEARRKSKKKGNQALKAELFQKGIDREIIQEVLSGQSEEDQYKLAEQAIAKKVFIWKKFDRLTFKRKGLEFLVRRGFDYSLSQELIENIAKKEYT